MTELLLYLYAEAPLHAGAADSEGPIDLPIQREAATGYPVMWGQGLKGALREAAVEAGWPDVETVFGSALTEDGGGPGGTKRGDLTVGDAQLVALPVATLQRTFAWATSEIALSRLSRKYERLASQRGQLPDVPSVDGGAGLASRGHWSGAQAVGPCAVTVEHDATVADWAERLALDALPNGGPFEPFTAKVQDDLLVVGSSVMPMLCRECTELTARVQLDDGKQVKQLFYSEYLPAETILAASLTLRNGGAEILGRLRHLLDGALLRLGGDETVGKGLAWGRLVGAGQ